jgi:PGF-pre-PGF domain-containing protein
MRKQFILLWILAIMIFLSNSTIAQSYLTENQTWQQNLTKISYGSLAFGDIDNDGNLDLALIGCNNAPSNTCDGYISKIYINNGTTLTENQTWQQNLVSVNRGSMSLGDIDNDGNLDLTLIGCNNGGGNSVCNGYVSKVYINNGTTFIENSTWQQNLTGAYMSSQTLGDINNDGNLDLALIGGGNDGVMSKIYINNGTTLTENQTWQGNLTGVYRGSVSFGDIDNDGDMDLVLTGHDSGYIPRTKVYINNGTTFIENSTWQQNLLNAGWSSIALGDYDNDDDLDLTIIGHTAQDNHRIYENNGVTFVEVQVDAQHGGDLAPIFDGSVAFGDYDNDGYLDIVATGSEGYTTIYKYNHSTPPFTGYSEDEENIIGLEYGSSAVWGNIYQSDLDLIVVGATAPLGRQAKIYINNISTHNNPPNIPTSFSSSYSNGRLNLTWGGGFDSETGPFGLYYNMRVGTIPDGNDIVSGVYGGSSNPASGYFGNMMQRKSILLNVHLDPGQTVYWSVQTIDTGLAKSSWSTEQNYTISNDSTSPAIIVNSPPNQYNTSNITIIFNATVYDLVNLTNVSLWGSWGGWHVNETNSSGINSTDYIFARNLTGYADGNYSWQMISYDNSSNYQLSPLRLFTLDTTDPSVSLLSPGDGSASDGVVTFRYNVSDISISSCSLVVNGAVDQTNTTITVNSEQTFSKSLTSGSYSWQVNCTDAVGHVGSSNVRTMAISNAVVSTPSGGGGLISTARNISQTNTTTSNVNSSEITPLGNATISFLEAGKTATVYSVGEIGRISILARNTVQNASLTVRKISDLPLSIPELDGAYAYMEVRKENITNSDIDSATILFSVNRSWIEVNNINESTITLNRYTTQWERLPTFRVNETSSEILFEAQTPGFSYFAITGEAVKETPDSWPILAVVIIVLLLIVIVGIFMLERRPTQRI